MPGHGSARSLDTHEFLLNAARDPGFAGGCDHVDFAAHAELGKIDSGFDGKAGVGQNAAHVVGFKIVEVRAGAMNLVGDVVAGAMREELGEARVANHGASGVVGLETMNRTILREG